METLRATLTGSRVLVLAARRLRSNAAPSRARRIIPTIHAGTHFRITLEADWARNLDVWGIAWQYAPEAVELPSGVHYRPDFYLPDNRLWAEVKGNHDERISKANELATVADVIILRPPLRGMADWESPSHPIGLGLTDRCPHRAVRWFVDLHDDNWHNHQDSDPLCWIDECFAGHSHAASSSGDDPRTTKFVQLKDSPRPATRRY